MCVKPAALTTHSPPKPFARPRTATRPSRALPLAHAAPTHARRLRDAFPADLTTHSPPKTSARPRTATRPPRVLPFPHAAPTHARRLRDAFPAEDPLPPPHSDTPFPSTSAPPRSADARPRSPDARPQAALCIPRRRPPLAHAQRHALPEHFRSPTQPRRTPAGCAMHSPPTSRPIPRSDTLPLLPFRFGHKKTAPHSACAMPNVSVDRRCGRSFGLVSRALFAAVAGRWRVGVGLRPQPWALRSQRCGRVLRA